MSAASHSEPRGEGDCPKEQNEEGDWGRQELPPAGREWKDILEKELHSRGLELHSQEVTQRGRSREEELSLEGRGLAEELARDWFSLDGDTVESRLFLVERVLPALVPGVEALLVELERRGQLGEVGGEVEGTPDFNPLNFLAQRLLRGAQQAGRGAPYARGLRQVLQELQGSGVEGQPSRLRDLKQAVQARQEEQQRTQRIRGRTAERRRECLRLQFSEWGLEPDGTLQLRVVQDALRSFQELTSTEESPAGVQYDRDLSDTAGASRLQQDSFVEYVSGCAAGLSQEQFSQLLQHLSLCSRDLQRAADTLRWRHTFTQLFHDCDTAESGLLDRHRVLALLENFYDSQSEGIQAALHNPRHWPLREEEHLTPDLWAESKTQWREVTESSRPPITRSTAASEGRADSELSNEEGAGSARGAGPAAEGDLSPEPWREEAAGLDPAELEPAEPRLVLESGAAVEGPESWGPVRGVSAFDRSALDRVQFIQLLETFLGETASDSMVHSLVGYLRGGYRETEQERLDRLKQARREAVLAQRARAIDELFERWDNEGRGFLERSEVEGVLSQYKEGAERAAMERAWQQGSPPLHSAPYLSGGQFRALLQAVLWELPPEGGQEGGFQGLLAFLAESAARSLAERTRGAARRKWLAQVQRAAERGGASLEPLYRVVFQTLHRDAETHGNGKQISASLSLLEGGDRLRYVACTAEDAPYVLNRELRREVAPVSFAAIDDGKPMHVPRVRLHGNIHFFNTVRPESEQKGSFVAVPLKDPRGRVFGVLGVDTLREPQERNIFLRHEIDFYQGVSSAFSMAFQHILTQRNILRIVDSATYWLHSRVLGVHNITTYLMESTGEQGGSYALRKMMMMDSETGHSRLLSAPSSLRRSDHLFRDYLFRCCDSSEPLRCVAYGEHRLAVPLRDPGGRALGVLDLSCGPRGALQPHEGRDLRAMVRMVQAACCQVVRESSGLARPACLLEAEGVGGEQRVALLFLRFMLQDLRGCVRQLDHQSFAELKSYKDPPTVVHHVLKAVLLMLHPQWVGTPEIDSWSQCRLKVNSDLTRKVALFDPTASSVQADCEQLQRCLAAVPRGEVWRHGSVPTEHLYNWVSVCLSLLEQGSRLRQVQTPPSSPLGATEEQPA
ncbi:EF-hand calcium-binding domain-containing protein 5 [Lepisosteus oculatus]|uniref:EF-hand calcium-binding domain-containing protein 5 n=1 Tax=Lepisosteus oculatus TaxID=7918 RepID=UPI003719D9D8